jgi:hypothetical protein
MPFPAQTSVAKALWELRPLLGLALFLLVTGVLIPVVRRRRKFSEVAGVPAVPPQVPKEPPQTEDGHTSGDRFVVIVGFESWDTFALGEEVELTSWYFVPYDSGTEYHFVSTKTGQKKRWTIRDKEPWDTWVSRLRKAV